MKFPYFPWRIFWNFFWTMVALFNIFFIGSLGVASYLFDFSFFTPRPLLFTGGFFVLSAVGSAWFSYRFSVPLRNLILKALGIANKKYATEFDEDDVLVDQPGEYVELEQALDKIRRKLKKRRLQLSHEREESQALISSMGEAIVSVDLDERLTFFNSQFGAQFLSQELVASKSPGAAVPLTQCFREPEILEVFTLALKQGVSKSVQIKLFAKLDSQPKYFSVRVSPLHEEKTREIYGALAVFHDITELKKAEKIRIEFVENASHELRTPLTAVKGFVETVREDVKNGRLGEVPHFLSIVAKNVDRLTELVSDMLTISSLEFNSSLKIEPLNPQVVTEEVISRLSRLAMDKKIMIKTRVDVPDFKADGRKVEQVLSNLIGNAIKYIPEGGLIEVRWSPDPQHGTILSVKDNGPGIALEHQDRLFERFYRVDKGRSRDVGGTGLGLSIVKHIMQGHRGSVTLTSAQGKGAEFTCFFPQLP
jgi:two-component system phosphate regulon sensor histidine kinase PhoR